MQIYSSIKEEIVHGLDFGSAYVWLDVYRTSNSVGDRRDGVKDSQ